MEVVGIVRLIAFLRSRVASVGGPSGGLAFSGVSTERPPILGARLHKWVVGIFSVIRFSERIQCSLRGSYGSKDI